MSHLDDETLALLALGEDVADAPQRQHLATCATCAAALAELRTTASLGRSALAVGDLSVPGPRVWAGIEQELGFRASTTMTATPHLAPRRRPRRIVVAAVLAVAAAAVVAVAGVRLLAPAAPKVVASASLAGFPAWPGASGQATVTSSQDGRILDLRLDARSAPAQYREVWLISADQKRLISLGVLRGASGEFAVPQGVDLERYDIVDVSSEPRDGNPKHSGDSIVRGALQVGS